MLESRSSPRSTWVISIVASSTGAVRVYSGSPLARQTAKSGTNSVSKVMSPRTRSFQVIDPSGIRNRTIEVRPSASKADRCSSLSSRQKPS